MSEITTSMQEQFDKLHRSLYTDALAKADEDGKYAINRAVDELKEFIRQVEEGVGIDITDPAFTMGFSFMLNIVLDAVLQIGRAHV